MMKKDGVPDSSAGCGAGSSNGSDPPVCCGATVHADLVSDRFSPERLATAWVDTPLGKVPQVATRLTWRDRLGSIRVRLGIGRMRYAVEPGLYAVGSPTSKSPVLVTANYKLSFDHLRKNVPGMDAWILVLDTHGINVWCAAGKGSFGTDEIVRRIEVTELAKVVSHRRMIVPQLGASGTCAHEVQERSGFTVIYGPIRATDIPAFFALRRRATPEMRRVRFDLVDRAVLIPVEIVLGAKPALLVAACLVLLAGLGSGGYSVSRALVDGSLAAALFLGMFVLGAALTPVLLPWLPGRAFSVKGAWLGAALALLAVGGFGWAYPRVQFGSGLSAAAWLVLLPAMTSFVALNFTGASTFTSLSGVRKETAVSVPIQLVFTVVAAGLWITGRFV